MFKLVDNMLIGGRDYAQLADRFEALASNKVQVGSRVSFASYITKGTTQYPVPRRWRR